MPGRFAPTPSGRMHIGNIYAMLGAWLSARGRGDEIFLRMEDIDEPRVVPGAADAMMDDLRWLGMDWDDEPAFQSQRHEIYEEALRCLQNSPAPQDATLMDSTRQESISQNTPEPQAEVQTDSPVRPHTRPHRPRNLPLIYPCFCSRADIRAASAPQEGDRFMVYPGTCRRLAAHEPQQVQERLDRGDRHSLRIALPSGAHASVSFHDEIFGQQTFDLHHEIGDTIVRRADGLFSYQLVVVVDDLTMGVDDIVRGRDLLRSNALQIYIRGKLVEAGFAPAVQPRYTHLPLIDNSAGQRLAKRERSLDMGILRNNGATAEQIVGYCAWLLGLQGRQSAEPQPMSADEALCEFRKSGWSALCEDHADRLLDTERFNEYFGL